jgi:hypothetical protein
MVNFKVLFSLKFYRYVSGLSVLHALFFHENWPQGVALHMAHQPQFSKSIVIDAGSQVASLLEEVVANVMECNSRHK